MLLNAGLLAQLTPGDKTVVAYSQRPYSMQSRILWTLSGTRKVTLLLAILWAGCDDTAFLQACQETTGASDNGLTCVTNYWLRISCVWNTTAQPLNKAPSYWLEFQYCDDETFPKFECRLANVGEHLNCSFEPEMEERESFMSEDYFEVTLHSKMSGYQTSVSMNSTFLPARNIKPEAPGNLTVARNSSGYLITWSSNYESHPYGSFENNLRYQLLYRRSGSPDEGTVVQLLGKTQHIDDVHLETDTQYTAVVSSRPGPDYQGQWSEWSPPVHWRTKAIPMRRLGALRFLWNIALPMCVVAGILLCFVFTPTARLKVKVWPVIPTPAPYFQPLFKSYKGNFRSWLLSQGGPGEPLKMEEVEKIDTVTEAWPLRGEETRPPSPAWCPAPCPAPYVTAGNEVWCAGGPAPCPAQGDRPDTPLSMSLIEVGLAEIFGSRSLGLVLAGEGEWEAEDPTPGLDWEPENLMPNLDWGPENPTPDLDGEPKIPILSLDSCWPREPLTALPKGLCAHQDYCTLSGPHNELVPGAALRPTSTGVDKDHGSGSSHNALGPQAEVDDVES